MEEKKSDESEVREENEEEEEEEVKDVEKGEVALQEHVVESNNNYGDFQLSRMERLNPSNPLRIVINSNTRVPTFSPSQRSHPSHP